MGFGHNIFMFLRVIDIGHNTMAYFRWKVRNENKYCYLVEGYRNEEGKVRQRTLSYLGSSSEVAYSESGECYRCGAESELWWELCSDCLADDCKSGIVFSEGVVASIVERGLISPLFQDYEAVYEGGYPVQYAVYKCSECGVLSVSTHSLGAGSRLEGHRKRVHGGDG